MLAGAAQAATLRIGLNEDPDALDPARGGSFVGRVVFAAVCDKLVDIDAQNNFVPQLATSWAWSADNLALTVTLRDGVRFHDGQAMDADAVKANLERYRGAPESLRKGELKPVSSVEVVDPHTVRLHLSQPYAPLVAVLADRAGMMISPKALGRDVTPDLPCAGPFKLTERVAQDRIVVDRFPGYWNADAIKLDRIVYHPQPDTTVRLVNLQAGQLDMVERLGPTDVATVKKNPKLQADQPDRAGLLLDEHQSGGGQSAEGSARACRAGGRDRPRRAQSGGVRRAVHSIEPVRGAGQPLLGSRSSGAAARPGEGEGAAEGGGAGASRASRC